MHWRPDSGEQLLYGARHVTYTRGHQLVEVRGEVMLQKDIQDTLLNNYGTFTFNGTATANSAAKFLAMPWSTFLLGIPSAITQDAPIRRAGQTAGPPPCSLRTTTKFSHV